MNKNFKFLGLGLALVGGLLLLGVISPFPSNTSCVGLYIFGTCLGYYSSNSSGDNFLLGIILLPVGFFLFVRSGKR